MAKFEKGDRVVLVNPDVHDKEFRNLHGGETGDVMSVDRVGWPCVVMDSGKIYFFAPDQLAHFGSVSPTAPSADSAKPETKLSEPFVQFAMELILQFGVPVTDQAIETARKLQEASE